MCSSVVLISSFDPWSLTASVTSLSLLELDGFGDVRLRLLMFGWGSRRASVLMRSVEVTVEGGGVNGFVVFPCEAGIKPWR